MPATIPTEGHASRHAAVRARLARNQSPDEIAAALDVPKSVVRRIVSDPALTGRPRHVKTVQFYVDTLDRAAPEAHARGLHVNELVRQIVESVLDGGLVEAVLDDGR